MPHSSPWAPLDIPSCNILSFLFPPNVIPSQQPVWLDATNPSNNLSPAQMLSWIKRFAVGLDGIGVAPHESIMVFSPNHLFVPMVYLAAAGSKRYFTGANPIYTVNEVAYQMKAIQAAVVLVHPSLLDTGIAAAKQAKIPVNRLFIFSDKECPMTRGVRDWRSMIVSEEESESWEWDNLENDGRAEQTTAAINFSSGTTGLPKGVCITHRNLVANTSQAIFNHFQGTKYSPNNPSPEKWLAFLPLYHAYSQLFTINIACKLQITVYIMPKFSFENFLKHIHELKITTIHLVPPVLLMMVKRPETRKYDISSLKHVFSGAAPLSSDLQNEVMNRFGGMVVCQGWGMTETTCAGIMTPGTTRDILGSIGYLLPNTEARIVADDGEEVTKDGEPGELWLRGPQIMLGYWNNEVATQESITSDRWFKTGDVAIVRRSKWWIVDRKKELIKVNGLQVAPAELEAVLLELEDVADAVVVGITVHGEELPRAYVVLQERAVGNIDGRDIQDFVARKVAKHKKLTGGVKFVNEIPRLASGKIVRKLTKEWAKLDARDVEATVKSRI